MFLIHLQLFNKDDYRKFKLVVLHSFLINTAQRHSLSLGWLPIKERAEMRIINLCYQALHNKNFPELNFAPKKRLLRACNNGPMVEISGYRNSFTSRATHLFKELPKNIRQLKKTKYS